MATLGTLASFNDTTGFSGASGLLVDAAGDLFGATSIGGTPGQDGTVFELVNNGYGSYTLTTLVSFNGENGAAPSGDLIMDAAGDLFGTTMYGGAYNYGTVFEIKTSATSATGYASTPTTLATFDFTNGRAPYAGLVTDAAGDLFGTTAYGGANGQFWGGYGTVFEIAKTSTGYASTPTTLVNFNGPNGERPTDTLIVDAAGNLFGTTSEGGASGKFEGSEEPMFVGGDGTVFEIGKTSTGYASTPTTLVSFNGTDGADPEGGLIADPAGDLFGTATGGALGGWGTVFEIAKTAGGYASTPTTLVRFNGTDGGSAFGPLIADAVGDLFGTTFIGGAYTYGTVFEVAKTPGGYASTPTTLASFNDVWPNGALAADANGDLFGTTVFGGVYDGGEVFELTGTGFQVVPTFVLTTGKDTVVWGTGNAIIVAASNTLSTGDDINPGGSNNTLVLTGGGTFNLAAPTTLMNIQSVKAQEGQGATAQTVTLRAGLNLSVNVASDTSGDASPTITIVGAANSDVINLGSGNDTVTLGAGETVNGRGGNNRITVTATSETVNGGSGNNTIIVTASSIGATIHGGSGNNTLEISGGGKPVMGSTITGISSVELLNAAYLTLNSIPDLRVFGTTAQVSGSTIGNFQAGDTIDLTNLAYATAVLTDVVVGAASTGLTVTDGTNTAALTLSGAFGAGSFQLSSDGSGGTDISYLPSVGYTLPAVAVTLMLGSLPNTVTTTAADLVAGDSIDGGSSGSNTLALSGGGTFNLAAPRTLENFSTIKVHEGSGTTLNLRAGLNATVNVTGSAGITIVGAANSDVINLGSGNDTVTLGAGETVNGGGGNNSITVTSANETVNGGSGNNAIIVTASSIGATINGGSGTNTLEIGGGGKPVMGSTITGISSVELLNAAYLTLNSIPDLRVFGTTAQVSGSTIGNFQAGDTIDLTNLADATAVLTGITVGATSTALRVTDGTNTAAITLSGAFGAGSFQLSGDGSGGTDISFLPSVGYAYTLPAVPAALTLGSLSNTVTTTAADLVAGDSIDGGPSGSNTLVLSGGGTFNLAVPRTLEDFSTITVQGGVGTTLDLRAGLNATVNVTGTAGITIVGAANSDVINLGSGNNTVTLGAGESIISGGINEHVIASASNAGAQVSGLGVGSELEITSGGTVTLNSATGGSAGDPLLVKLDVAANLTLSPMQFINAVGSNSNETITAEATQQTLTGGGGSDTLVGYAGGYDTFKDTAAGLNGDTIGNFLSTDQIDITNLLPGTAVLTATASGANTAVTVVSGATRTSFLMTGSFTQSGFHVTTDGAVGTLITYLTLPA